MTVYISVSFSDGSDLELRLIGGGSRCAGVVEVEIQKIVGKVCNRVWTLQEADIACKQLGCGSAVETSSIMYSKTKPSKVWLEVVNCNGNETSLWDCKNSQWSEETCSYGEAKVTCSGKTFKLLVKKSLNSKNIFEIEKKHCSP